VIVLDRGELLFDGPPPALVQAAGQRPGTDFEHALVAFLSQRETR
jgi:hypothetical protein